jgi:hypothetical protein
MTPWERMIDELIRRQNSTTVDGGSVPDVPEDEPFLGAAAGSPAPSTPEPLGWEMGGQQRLHEQVLYDRGLLEEDRARFDSLYGSAPGSIQAEGALANTSDDAWMQWLNGEYSGLGSLQTPTYKGGYTSAAGTASADPLSILGQYDAANRFRQLSDPSLTAAERSMMEISRRKQERDQRAARTAALSSLRGRGFASGGDEIAALLGSQQETGQRRSLEDLAARGQAVGRSMDALKGYGDITGQMREQSFGEQFKTGTARDATSEFNISQRQEYDKFVADLQQKELQNRFDRSSSLFEQGRAVTGDKYKRGVADEVYQLDALGAAPGGGSSGASSSIAFTDYLKAIEGARQADEAAGILSDEPEESITDDPIGYITRKLKIG